MEGRRATAAGVSGSRARPTSSRKVTAVAESGSSKLGTRGRAISYAVLTSITEGLWMVAREGRVQVGRANENLPSHEFLSVTAETP